MSAPSTALRIYDLMLPYRVEFKTYDSTIFRGNLHHAPDARQHTPIKTFVRGIGLTQNNIRKAGFATSSRQDVMDVETLQFWPLEADEAAGKGGSVLSPNYERDWPIIVKKMADRDGNISSNNRLTMASFWEVYKARLTDVFSIIRASLLWVTVTEDIVCEPLDFTKGRFDKLECPEEICVIQGD
ncbi:putative AB hydrolase-1 domain-containing protein [Seiridium unicorne]|uniref:AB hydrolase-1 domain-containing protein n=1 Tax=Seiridium unicorne TaxID=138068 RepID=A0ABR2V8W0_9PEZI